VPDLNPSPPTTIYGGALGELDQIDQAVYRAIASTPSPSLDLVLSRLSSAADHSTRGRWPTAWLERSTQRGGWS
jgi:hypothetical protein